MAEWVVSCTGGPHPGQWLVSRGTSPPDELRVHGDDTGRYRIRAITSRELPGTGTVPVAAYTWLPGTGWCIHLLPRDSCADCRGTLPSSRRAAHPGMPVDWDRAAESAEQVMASGPGPWILAEFYGRCKGCGEKTEPGDMIAFSEEDGGWISTCCLAPGDTLS